MECAGEKKRTGHSDSCYVQNRRAVAIQRRIAFAGTLWNNRGMDTSWLIAILAGSLLGVLAFIFYLVRWTAIRADRNCRELAAQLRLEVKRTSRRWLPQFASPFLTGTIQGRSVRIHTYTVSAGRNQETWCETMMYSPNKYDLTLTISTRPLFSGIAQIFTKNVVKTGDETFDKHLWIQTNAPGFMQAALIPEMRTRIAEIWTRQRLKGSLKVEYDKLKYSERGSFSNQKICRHMAASVDLLLDIATLVETYTP